MSATRLAVLVAAVLACRAPAQCVPPAPSGGLATQFTGASSLTPVAPYGANAWFDVTVTNGVALTGIAVDLDNPSAVGQLGDVDLWVRWPGPSTAVGQHTVGTGGASPALPPGWLRFGVAQVTIAPPGTPSVGVFATPVTLAEGTYGMAVNFLQVAAGQPAAGTPLRPVWADPGTASVPTAFGDQFVQAEALGVQTAAWTGSLVAPAVADVRFDYSVPANAAYSTSYGVGCGSPAALAHMRLAQRPRVGQPLLIDIVDVDPSIGASLLVFSPTSLPGIDLGSVGIAGCAGWIGGPFLLTFLVFGPGPYQILATPAVPASLNNIDLYIQSVLFSTAVPPWNAANLLVSDAVCIHYAPN